MSKPYLYKPGEGMGGKLEFIKNFHDRSKRSMLDTLVDKEYKKIQKKLSTS